MRSLTASKHGGETQDASSRLPAERGEINSEGEMTAKRPTPPPNREKPVMATSPPPPRPKSVASACCGADATQADKASVRPPKWHTGEDMPDEPDVFHGEAAVSPRCGDGLQESQLAQLAKIVNEVNDASQRLTNFYWEIRSQSQK